MKLHDLNGPWKTSHRISTKHFEAERRSIRSKVEEDEKQLNRKDSISVKLLICDESVYCRDDTCRFVHARRR